MEKAEFEKYLKERYQDQVDWFDRKAASMKTRYSLLQFLVIVLAASTTVVAALGASSRMADAWRWATVVVSALATVGTTTLSTFKYRETWLNYRGTFDALKREKSFYLAQTANYRESTDREALFVQRVETILAQESAEWQAIQSLKDQTDKPKSGNQ